MILKKFWYQKYENPSKTKVIVKWGKKRSGPFMGKKMIAL